MLRVVFFHGLESGPGGTKATYLAERFQTLTPSLPAGDFPACLDAGRRALAEQRPDVAVGSSFGGAILLALLREGAWRGPTLLLAQAGEALGLCDRLPEGVPVLLVHGTRDEVIDPAGSRRLAASGSPGLVLLREPDDEHRLVSLTADETLAELVREAHRLGR